MNLSTYDVETVSEYEDLLNEYYGKIIVTSLVDSADAISPLFPVHEEFCNIDGEFGIKNSVIKVAGTKIISITDPITVDPSTVDDQTVTDTIDGVFVFNQTALVSDGGCCPNNDNETNYWARGPRRRLVEEYRIFDATVVHADIGGLFRFTQVIAVRAFGISQKRVGIWPVQWWNLNAVTSLILAIDINFTHNFNQSGITSPIDIDESNGPEPIASSIDMLIIRRGPTQISFALFRPPALMTCVTNVEEIFTNTAPNPDVFVEIDCP